jgi:hypothetical protein
MFFIQIVDDIQGRRKWHSTLDLDVIEGRRAREGGEGSVGQRNERHCQTTGVCHEAVTIKAIVLVANEAAQVNYLRSG